MGIDLMATATTGGVKTETLTDGTLVFRLRFRAYGRRRSVHLHERATATATAAVAGTSERPTSNSRTSSLASRQASGSRPSEHAPRARPIDAECPPFLVTPRDGCRPRSTASSAKQPIEQEHRGLTIAGALQSHLLPFFADYRMDEFDRELCLAIKAHLLKQARERREAITAGAVLRDGAGTAGRAALAGVLDPQDDRHSRDDPRRSRRGRPPRIQCGPRQAHARPGAQAQADVPGDRRAGGADRRGGEPGHLPRQPVAPIELGLTAAMVAHLHRQGRSPSPIAAELGLAKSTVSYHLSRLGLEVGRGYVGRRVVVEILGR